MTSRTPLRRSLLGVTSLIMILVVTGCGLFGRSRDADDRFVTPGSPRTSPSGDFTASVQAGPEQNGVATWVVVISDRTGAEVFHDDRAYSTRHGVRVTWLSSRDQLWILSSDVGRSYVEQHDGAWTRTAITPDTRSAVPDEIDRLG